MKKKDLVHHIIDNQFVPKQTKASAFAPINIALAKYWGKRDAQLHLPITDSFSVTNNVGTTTTIQQHSCDEIICNGKKLSPGMPFYDRLIQFADLFRPSKDFFFSISTSNTIPTGAGLASSASGFAAFVLALNSFFNWNLSQQHLSILARLGSGSACRSVFPGFAHWVQGTNAMDSFAIPFNEWWDDLCFGIFFISSKKKDIDSRQAMQHTVETSSLYSFWPTQIEKNLCDIIFSIKTKNFDLFGQAIEQNALAMHATMFTAVPPICYWKEKTIKIQHAIWKARKNKVPVYFTMDAGPNIKAFFLKKDMQHIQQAFPELTLFSLLGPV